MNFKVFIMAFVLVVLAYTLDLETYRNLSTDGESGSTSSSSQIITSSIAIVAAFVGALIWKKLKIIIKTKIEIKTQMKMIIKNIYNLYNLFVYLI